MTNKRDLKKAINRICCDMFAECAAYSLYNSDKKENISAILTAILMMHNNHIRRVSHPEPGMKPKDYYKDLTEKFNAQIDEISDQIAGI